MGNHHTGARVPFQVWSHSWGHHRSRPLLKHCMGHIVHHTNTHFPEEWGPMLRACYGKVKGHLQATHVSHTHIKWAEKKNSSILLQCAEFWKCGKKQLCLQDWLRYREHVCECIHVCAQVGQCESHLKTVAGQYLVKDLKSDLILRVPDMIKLNVFGF